MEYIPLTLQQEDIYFDQLLHQGTPVYNIGARVLIKGKIDPKVFDEAFNAFVSQHESLRYRPVLVNDALFFNVAPVQKVALPVMDFSGHPYAESEANHFITDDFAIPFNFLEGKPLFRLILLKLSEESFILYSKYHHIIVDGWGTSILFKRLVQYYNELLSETLPRSVFDYAFRQYVQLDKEYRQSPRFEQDRLYWQSNLFGIRDPLFEYNSTHVKPESARKVIRVKRERYNNLILFAERHHTSLFHVITAALSIVLARFFQKNTLCIGVPVLNRSSHYYKQTVGLFMGISPLQITIKENDTLVTLMLKIRNQLREDYKHQRVPLSTILRDAGLIGEKSKLFDVTLSYEKHDYGNHFIKTETSVVPLSHFAERTGLAVYVREFDSTSDVTVDFDYNIHKLDGTLVDQIVLAVDTVVEKIDQLTAHIWTSIPLLNEQQLNRVLYGFNETTFPIAPNLTVCDLIDEQCSKFPDNIAIDDGTEKITYQQLQFQVNKIANVLKAAVDSHHEARIGVLLSRSVKLILAQLGVLKSGMAFIPLDPAFPSERIEYIVKHSKVSIILSDKGMWSAFEFPFVTMIDIDDALLRDDDNPLTAITLGDQVAAYVIYTSGSTGEPKGVEVSHQALTNLLVSLQHTPAISNDDTLFSVTTSSFDISILEFFLPLTVGARVFIVGDAVLCDVRATLQCINCVSPTIIQATPSFYQMLFDAGWGGQKNLIVLCGGDELSEALAEKILSSCAELWNMYGPTETTIWSTLKRIIFPNEAQVIGKPIANTQLYILDDTLNPLPVGVKGKLFIGGKGLSNGYLFQSQMTTDRFLKNPFQKEQKIYDTGDIGMWNSSGEIIFFGRGDHQVKVRGYRIELAEIERNIMLVNGVDQVVVVKKDSGVNAFLVAYIRTQEEAIQSRLRSILSNALPDYMIPNTFIIIEHFPLTPNKKIDRKALSERAIELDLQKSGIIENTIPVELVVIWQKVLNLSSTSADQNFFELGGHSLRLVQMAALINRAFNSAITAADIFQCPTLRQLAERVMSGIGGGIKMEKAPRNGNYALARNQKGLWTACQQPDLNIAYNMVGVLRVEGHLDVSRLENVVENIIQSSEALRSNFRFEHGQPVITLRDVDICKFNFIQRTLSNALELDVVVNELSKVPFSIETDLLLRGFMIVSLETTYLIFVSHHLVIDGESISLLLRKIEQLYRNAIIIPPPFEYLDYAYWTNHPDHSQLKSFWHAELQGVNNSSKIFKQNALIKHSVKQHSFTINVKDFAELKSIGTELKVSEFSILFTVLQLVTHRQFGVSNFCVGIAVNSRPQIDFSNVIGMFVTTLICRNQISACDKFGEMIEKTAQHLRQLLLHKDYCLSDAMRDSNLHNVPFELLVTYQEVDDSPLIILGEATATVIAFPPATARVPMVISFFSTSEEVRCEVEYNSTLFDETLIKLWCDKFQYLVMTIGKNITVPTQSIKLVNAEEDPTSLPMYEIQFNF